MNGLFYAVLEALLLVVALSMDAFVASFAYGAQRIKIPFSSAAIISVICTAMLAVSLLAGALLRPFLPQGLTQGVMLCAPFFCWVLQSCVTARSKL